MFETVLKARIPLIAVRTPDTLNAKDVIASIANCEVEEIDEATIITVKKAFHHGSSVIIAKSIKGEEMVYGALVEKGQTVVLLNWEGASPLVFNAGELPVPKDMVEALLSQVIEEDKLHGFVSVVGGLTLKEIAEICRIASSMDAGLTPSSITKVRRMYAGTLKGLSYVDTETLCYVADQWLEDWLIHMKPFFLGDYDRRLVPRGLLLEGPPGTGKTEGAKAVARTFGVPLYRLDLPAMMTKWLGDTEGHLRAALAQADREEPCVILIDEVEKVLRSDSEDGGVTTRMMSQILWWLQEHTSRVFTVMTTNDPSIIPPEVYRPGRIDEVVDMGGLKTPAEVKKFASVVYRSFSDLGIVKAGLTMHSKAAAPVAILAGELSLEKREFIPQVEVARAVYSIIRDMLVP